MFTGLVEEVGVLRSVRRGAHSSVLSIGAREILDDLKVGDSVAVNGVCLTATAIDSGGFTADVMHETLNRSSLSALTAGGRVNLERALPAGGRLGGHIVSGHIDGTGTITARRRDDNAVWYTVAASPSLLRYIVEKGSIAMDGISLTVAAPFWAARGRGMWSTWRPTSSANTWKSCCAPGMRRSPRNAASPWSFWRRTASEEDYYHVSIQHH